jgi:zinc ribbon protein
MEVIVASGLLLAVFAVLAYPLYQARRSLQFEAAGTLNDLLAQRDGVYATLRDLDLDYELGKLDAQDYTARREKYLAYAAVLLQTLDALRGDDGAQQGLSDEIEREVNALRTGTPALEPRVQTRRKTYKNGRQRPAAQVVAASRDQAAGYCTNCGHPRRPGDRFCAKCGQALS